MQLEKPANVDSQLRRLGYETEEKQRQHTMNSNCDSMQIKPKKGTNGHE